MNITNISEGPAGQVRGCRTTRFVAIHPTSRAIAKELGGPVWVVKSQITPGPRSRTFKVTPMERAA